MEKRIIRTGMTTIETLPDVPLGKILKQLEGKDAATCRLVNHFLKGQAEDFCTNWIIQINGACRVPTPLNCIAPLSSLKAKEVRILNWGRTRADSAYPHPLIFNYPEIIQTLNCYCNVLDMNPQDLDNLLRSLSNLQNLKLDLPSPKVQRAIFNNNSPYNFPNLRTLDLRLNNVLRARQSNADGDIFTIFLRLFNHSQLPQVTSISTDWRSVSDYNSAVMLTEALFVFLVRQGPVLKHVAHSDNRQIPFLNAGNGYVNTCRTLEKLQLNELPPFPLDLPWLQLLQGQTKLTHLDINRARISLRQFSNAILPQISSTLTNLSIYSLEVDNEAVDDDSDTIPQLDMVIFQSCLNLQKLTLRVYKETISIPKMINLSSLPKGIVALDIFNLTLEEKDLLMFCSNCPKLAQLSIRDTVDIKPNGLTGSVLRQVMDSVSLIKVFFAYGNVRKQSEDAEDLVEIRKLLCQENVQVLEDDGFQLCRVNVESRWFIMSV